MSEQHDQSASPGYMGPEGVPDTGDKQRESSLDRTIERVSVEPGQAGLDMGPHQQHDIGAGTSDIESSPYAGSASSDALDMADEEIPGRSEPSQNG